MTDISNRVKSMTTWLDYLRDNRIPLRLKAGESGLVDVRCDRVPLVAHDDRQVRWRQPLGCGDRVPEQRSTPDRMQDFGSRRLHARALPRSEDDDGGRVVIAHVRR